MAEATSEPGVLRHECGGAIATSLESGSLESGEFVALWKCLRCGDEKRVRHTRAEKGQPTQEAIAQP
jgi:hypothetical protein